MKMKYGKMKLIMLMMGIFFKYLAKKIICIHKKIIKKVLFKGNQTNKEDDLKDWKPVKI